MQVTKVPDPYSRALCGEDMSFPNSASFRFGLFEFDPASGDLRKRGLNVHLTSQARVLLGMLLETPGRLCTREEIQHRLWPANTFVDFEHGVNKVVHSLREALGESANNPKFIETVAAEGYRFMGQSLKQEPLNVQSHGDGGVERLAVLPIVTDPQGELIPMSKLITSLLIEKLANTDGVRVLAESTVKSQKLESLDPRQAGKNLGVDAVLAGELTRLNGHFLLQVELVDTADGALLGGALVQQDANPRTGCEEKFAADACLRIQPFLQSANGGKKPPESVVLPERSEKAG